MRPPQFLLNWLNYFWGVSGTRPTYELLVSEYLYGGLKTGRTKSPFDRIVFRSFSQSNEDGILQEIMTQIGETGSKTFIECGVGDGTENNSLLLLLNNWKGVWLGGEKLRVEIYSDVQLRFQRCWIHLENINSIITSSLDWLSLKKSEQLDVFSLDLDGNDYHLCKNLLQSGFLPKVWIQEYNAVFGPTVKWIMPYSKTHVWRRDSFFGASFASYCSLFGSYGYRAVACSATGANVFFVRHDLKFPFDTLPSESDIWLPPKYFLSQNGHRVSVKILKGLQSDPPPIAT